MGVTVDVVMASAYDFTNMYFLCSTTESKCFLSEPESSVCMKEEYTITHIYRIDES
jgi:hypothetical protein